VFGPLYHVAAYALIAHTGKLLIVQPRQSTLPGGSYSLPGSSLAGNHGHNALELHLRRTLLDQVGLSVGELKLVGSLASPAISGTLLNLIFATDYNSGVLRPNPELLEAAEWRALGELEAGADLPDWLRAAISVWKGQPTGKRSSFLGRNGPASWGNR
jgi:hypothetical protein